MSETEFGELTREFSESHWCTAPDPLSNKIFNGLKDHRKLVMELAHRLHTIDVLLQQARCPTECGQGECAFCWDRNIELEALKTLYKEYEL